MTTLQDVLDELGIEHVSASHKHGRPGWVQINCPWCGWGARKFHMGISLSTGAAACWRCGGRNAVAALTLTANIPEEKIRGLLEGISLEKAPVRHQGRLVIPGGVSAMRPVHRAYLAKRGLDADLVAGIWGVQGIGQTATLRWRLWIPIQHHGKVVSWTTRTLRPGAKPRYIAASAGEEAIPHKHILYGADYAHHAIIIHEGPIDVWAMGLGAVATCGTGYTRHQLLAMTKYPVRVVCFDRGAQAQRRAKELAHTLSLYPGTTHSIELETGDDPAEAHPDELAEIRNTFLGEG